MTETTQLVGEDWRPTTLDEPGAAELGARIEGAPPLLVPRDLLQGRCGLSDRELWELGVQTVPAGALSAGTGVVLRLVIVAAVAAMAVCLAIVTAAVAEFGEEGDLGVPAYTALVLLFALIAHAMLRLALGAAGRERARRLGQRRVAAEAVPPLLDPNGRLTVAVLDGPGVLRVLLVWLRGHPQDADVLEARVVAERRVPRDEPARAEDAVAALSEVAMLATRLRTDARDVEGVAAAEACGPLAAADAKDARRLVAAGGGAPAPPGQLTASDVRVGPGWAPDGTTEQGEAELARRLIRAKPRRWSAEALAPLVVGDVQEAARRPVSFPATTVRTPHAARPAWMRVGGSVLVVFLAYFVVSDPSSDLATEIVMRTIFLGATLWATWRIFRPQFLELPHRLRRRPLLRRVDDAAGNAASSLEAGLPGEQGAVVVITAAQGNRRLVRLMHLRRAVDVPEGILEARDLAEQILGPEDDVAETIGRFLRVADDRAFTARRGRESVERLRRLSRRLGITSADERGRGALVREPLVLLAVLVGSLGTIVGLIAIAVGISRDVVSGLEILSGSAILVAVAAALLACTRRWTRLGP